MKKIHCGVREKDFYDNEPCWYQQGIVKNPDKVCVNCAHYKFLHSIPIVIKDSTKIKSPPKVPGQKTKRTPYDGILLDFCNVKKWDLKAILDLYENHNIHRDSEDDITSEKYRIRDCRTRHDEQHTYCLIENERSKNFQSHMPDTFILPSQGSFKKLFGCLQKSQAEYRTFLDSCIKGNIDLPYLNNRMKETNISVPIFFYNPRTFSGKIKKREEAFIKWNPVLYLMGNGRCIEDAIDSEIIHAILRREGILFSKVKRCANPRCRDYFIYNRRSGETCSPECHVEYNNLTRRK